MKQDLIYVLKYNTISFDPYIRTNKIKILSNNYSCNSGRSRIYDFERDYHPKYVLEVLLYFLSKETFYWKLFNNRSKKYLKLNE